MYLRQNCVIIMFSELNILVHFYLHRAKKILRELTYSFPTIYFHASQNYVTLVFTRPEHFTLLKFHALLTSKFCNNKSQYSD